MSAFAAPPSPHSEALFAALSSQFLAAIPENEKEVENLSRESRSQVCGEQRWSAGDVG